MEVRCENCGQVNHVPPLADGKKAICGKCQSPLKPGVTTMTTANFKENISDGGAWVIDFWAPWCGPCRMISPIIEQLAAERSDVRFGKVNIDEQDALAVEFGVRSIPLLLFLKGQVRGKVVGAVPRAQIEAAIKQYLG